ncbi:hypothetical protein IMG5_021720 [Ichthyophthirius multifiliis]|uniref:Rhodanese domain-containing protein n=1 Tax=Ichthyophthirius multifiliis TaxID=5932 RepID=G0QKT7_ICHMU|nr:hypothetical protein IMG5_021720 [Ichthyophthirius multifiliis]EGR34172.1 hypothetical protein IMG5_021720 [Ichthyophthirius multifiliis]|eukprot:XP_004039476.1 hypothetical protein IMG5_021720 [Ichthyophthirius multifiliis]
MIFVNNIKNLFITKIQQLVFQKSYNKTSQNYNLIECEELKKLIDQKADIKILYAYQAPISIQNKVIKLDHIPQSIMLNLQELDGKNNSKYQKIPSDQQFNSLMQKQNIKKQQKVIIYCNSITNSTRLHYLMDIFGYQNLYYLNGGLLRWYQLGFPLKQEYVLQQENQNIIEKKDDYSYKLNKEKLAFLEDIVEINQNYNNSDYLIIDTRKPQQYFEGQEFQWKHIPVLNVMIQKDGRFINKQQIENIFQEKDIDLNKLIISTCKRGYQATVFNFLGYYTFGDYYKGKVYDGSWDEYLQYKISQQKN